jgi:hypothetical protein
MSYYCSATVEFPCNLFHTVSVLVMNLHAAYFPFPFATAKLCSRAPRGMFLIVEVFL